MRHHNSNRKFGRKSNLRLALMRSLAEGLLEHGKITTTQAKAKELSSFVEKLITRGKDATVHDRRILASRLGTPARAKTLVEKVAPRYKERSGGYTRVVKLPHRPSDGSPMAMIELV
jgi:large subunit ribosomal protein L17